MSAALSPGSSWLLVVVVVGLVVMAVCSPDPRQPLTALCLILAAVGTALLLAELTVRVGPQPPQLSDYFHDAEPPAPTDP